MTAVVLVLWLGTCASDWVHVQPEGAHIRAALGKEGLRDLGTRRGHISASLNFADGTWLGIQAYEFLDDDTDATLYLSLPNPQSGTRWKLGRSSDGAWARYTIHDIRLDRGLSYGTDREHRGLVVLRRFDEKTRIVEGTFEFEAAAGPQTLPVRRGSFKVRYEVDGPGGE